MDISGFHRAIADVNALTVQRFPAQHPSRSVTESVPVLRFNTYYRFCDVQIGAKHALPSIRDPIHFVFFTEVPLLVYWFRYFTRKDLRHLCDTHDINVGHGETKATMSSYLMQHECTDTCINAIYIFKVLPSPRPLNGFLLPFLPAVGSIVTSTNTAEIDSVHVNTDIPTTATAIPISNVHVEDAPGTGISPQLEPLPSYQLVEDDDHLTPLNDEKKIEIMSQWQRETCTSAIRVVVCAVCAIKTTKVGSSWIHASHIKLSLLRNDRLPEMLLPDKYDFQLYDRAVLSWKGLERMDALAHMRICDKCLSSLNEGRMPKFSLANDLYYAHDRLPPSVKLAFDQSTTFDRMLICRARCNNICCKFTMSPVIHLDRSEDTQRSGILARARQGVRGNIMVLPLDTMRINEVLPPSSSSIRDTMCAIFVGSSLPSRSALLSRKVMPLLVRKSRVKTMIEFLLKSNPHYCPTNGFRFSQENLDNIFDGPHDEGIPNAVQIGHVASNDALHAATSDYTPRGDNFEEWNGNSEDLLMENVGFTDGNDSPMNYLAMKALALERCLLGKPFIASGTGNDPVSDFRDPCILDWLFPHLDPWGIGGFFHPHRVQRIGLQEQVSHMLMMDDSVFERDPEFAFVFYNIIRKMNVARSMRFTVPHKFHQRIAADLLSVDPDVLVNLSDKCKKDPFYKATTEQEQDALRLLSSVTMVARHIPGSNGYKVMLRNQIRALVNFMGPPTLFITLNPSDVDNPIVRLFAGHDISIDDVMGGEYMGGWERRLFAAQHPAACALFFHLMISKFISVVLRFGQRDSGLFGKCNAYYGTVEAQGKGTLHCHMLIWLKGHLPPHLLRARLAESKEYQKQVFQWLESIIKCEFPVADARISSQPSFRIRHEESGNPHPGTISAPSIYPVTPGLPNTEYWTEFRGYLTQLLHEYNWHVHNATCWKYLRRGEAKIDKNCRMRMDGVTQETTSVDTEGGILLRRHHPNIAAYTDCVTVMMKSNTEIKFIGSGTAARDLVFYITDYVTKPSLPVHVGLSALVYAINKANNTWDLSPGNPTNDFAMSAVIMAVNSMMGRHEISHPQVMSYLVGGGDHYTSNTFAILYWTVFVAYVDSCFADTSDECRIIEGSSSGANIDLTVRPGSITASNQQLDYIWRSESNDFDSLCLYDFVGYVFKIAFSRLADLNVPHPGTFSTSDHPQRWSHYLKLRGKFHVPVLLGPSIPNPKRSEEVKDRWAMYMLILFKPWRQAKDLKAADESWLDAYNAYKYNLTTRHTGIINNMNSFSESTDTRSFRPRHRERADVALSTLSDSHLAELISQSGLQEFGDLTSNLQVGANIFMFSDENSDCHSELEEQVANRIGSDVMAGLNMCLPTLPSGRSRDDRQLETSMVADEDRPRLAQYSSVMQLKRKRIVQGDDIDSEDREYPQNSKRRRTERHRSPIAERAVAFNDARSFDYSMAIGFASEVAIDMNLMSNPEQFRAFMLVADHIASGRVHQLLLYISGVGGTGKSHLIKSIVLLFERLNRRNELLLGAPTGIAAVLIGGHTLHSLIKSNPSNQNRSNIAALTEIWTRIRYLIIDEISMVGARFLSQLSTRIRQGKGSTTPCFDQPYGGVSVIFMGDFGQLKPPKQVALYAHQIIKNPFFSVGSNVDEITAMNGIILWRQVSTVVELVQNQRHINDPQYAEFLLRLREGKCIKGKNLGDRDDLAYVKTRMLSALITNSDELASFWDAPIIVGSKVIRDALNARMISYNANRMDSEVAVYHSRDFVSRVTVPEGLRNRLWDIASTHNRESFGRLPLFAGMKVMVTENLAFGHGIVNGSEGTVSSIQYDLDNLGRKYAAVVYVLIPDCGVDIPGLGRDIVPIFPVSTRIEYKFSLSSEIVSSGFVRKQVPLVPAYAYTDFKAQGRTLSKVIIDLTTARGQGVYVMLSRVTSLKGLIILRWFPPTKIFSRLPEELREELARLHLLSKIDSSVPTFRN